MTNAELISALDQLSATMISVATGGGDINSMKAAYVWLHDEVSGELAERGVRDELPYRDLWQWYGRWKAGDLPSWQSRRVFVSNLFDNIRQQLNTTNHTPYEPTGWARVDRAVKDMQVRLSSASVEEHFQTVGLLGREILISLGKAVFDPAMHPTFDEVTASQTDAKRMLEAYIAVELAGGSNDQLRKFVRSALDLALSLQHKRTATYRDAALCTEAVVAVAHLIAIISNRRQGGLESQE